MKMQEWPGRLDSAEIKMLYPVVSDNGSFGREQTSVLVIPIPELAKGRNLLSAAEANILEA